MIYLDYAANCPADKEVLNVFNNITRQYIGNPNSIHKLGKMAKNEIDLSTKKISQILNIKENEIIYTSGATEANNLAIKGIANKYKNVGKHIITTNLEHSSVLSPVQSLKDKGFEVDIVDILDNGLIDMEHLQSLLREDTILVSICNVDSELGIIQNIDEIGNLLKSYPNSIFHTDISQAVGKIPIDLTNIDLASMSAHKFFGLNGVGLLIKKENILLEPIILGGSSTTIYRSGTPFTALISSTAKALEISNKNLQNNYNHVKGLNAILREGLCKYKNVFINSYDDNSPFILNFSVKGIKSKLLTEELEKHDIYISTKSACCSKNLISRPVHALTKDKKIATSSVRLSLSHLTTEEDIKNFLQYFKECYNNLI